MFLRALTTTTLSMIPRRSTYRGLDIPIVNDRLLTVSVPSLTQRARFADAILVAADGLRTTSGLKYPVVQDSARH
jgi:hypothetical protein